MGLLTGRSPFELAKVQKTARPGSRGSRGWQRLLQAELEQVDLVSRHHDPVLQPRHLSLAAALEPQVALPDGQRACRKPESELEVHTESSTHAADRSLPPEPAWQWQHCPAVPVLGPRRGCCSACCSAGPSAGFARWPASLHGPLGPGSEPVMAPMTGGGVGAAGSEGCACTWPPDRM